MPRKLHRLNGGLNGDVFSASGTLKFSRRKPPQITEEFHEYVENLGIYGITVEYEELTINTKDPPYVQATISVSGSIEPESKPSVESNMKTLLTFPPGYASTKRHGASS